MKKLLSILLAVMMVCTLCVIPASAASPKLSKSTANIPIGYSLTLKVSNADEVEWSTKDKSIAKIKSTSGKTAKIVGVSTGSTYIYAKTNGKTLKCKVTVKKSFITAAEDKVLVSKGDKATLTFNVSGSKKIVYSNGSPEKCKITSAKWSGNKLKLTVKGTASGSVLIKVYAKGYSSSTLETVTVTIGDDAASDSAESTLTEAEKVVELVNAKRAEKGLSALTMDDKLNEVAKLRAEELLQKCSHTRPNGTACFTAFDDLEVSYEFAAENIAAGRSNAKDVMSDWLSSQGHYDNIMNSSAKKIGVALVKVSGGYTYYWVQVFTD